MKPHHIVLTTLALLAGCVADDAGLSVPQRPLRLDSFTLAMAGAANGNWPVAVDLVRVQDEALVQSLLAIEATAWFGSAGDRFRKAHPGARIDSWQIVPGTVVGPIDLSIEEDVGGVLFCGYRTLTSVPLRVERDGHVTVRIDDSGCTLHGGEPSRESTVFERLLGPVPGS